MRIFDMTPEEAYKDYVAFCEENGFNAATKEQFLQFNDLMKEKTLTDE